MTSRKSRAVIFVPEGTTLEVTSRCFDHCEARGYDVAGVVRGNWPAVVEMIRDRIATIIVIDRLDHLDPDREPRIEVAEQISRPPGAGRYCESASPRRRRPRLL